ncbi:hypothetical protein H072_3715 [Dactylellina haptotyla CBS 200.50]|uniref:Essential protein Yae1 N-terminal domain-containing protein n=1 Tax=Dactylellina haptotyla (strain CBS 200.50) TaxID=1284197 RepID=S8AH18_DACHA|nr:hypothetical protein H072_3715 [Dactylellina haptotyla CBS 200.50]
MADEADVDIFDAVLNLEEDYYAQGHKEGSLAGAAAGRLEGRAFGIEKGFEKYLALGIVKGRTKIWQARVEDTSFKHGDIKISNPRHLKHISLLETLTTTPPIRNEEDDVEEVDDRIRRGKAKVKILENTLKESVPDEEETGVPATKSNSGAGVKVSGATGLETEFEDFKIRRS